MALEEIEPDVLKEIKKQRGRWRELVIFDKSCMATDEFLAEFNSYLNILKNKKMLPIASAYVFKDEIEGASLMPSKYQDCYENVGISFHMFKN